MVTAWWRVLQTQPTRDAILTLVAQSAFETGWWQKMHCFNPGNAKSLQRTGDWYFVKCTEYIDPDRAEAMRAAAGKTASGMPNVELGALVNVAKAGDPPRLKRHVTLLPDHPGSCFRAFSSLPEGVSDHLSLVAGRYEKALGLLVEGDTVGYIRELGRSVYYTDSFDHYLATTRACGRMIDGLPIDLSPPPADIAGRLAADQDAILRAFTPEDK